MNEFINVKPLWACIQNVLPQVYDDTISYQELLYKVISKLNELVENNNKLPGYIADLIREYISSGEIEKVLAEVLATYMLNVKFPPAGLEPASGDGSKDDTEAIQGCIDYAQSHGGMAVYFPSGSYLCNSLDIAGKCTMFGYDRYNTRIVLKGGATRPLLNGHVDEFSLNGLGFDGNMDIQVNNVNLIDITVGSGIITNVFVTDGYDLIKAQVDVDLQISDVVFNHAVENGLDVSGSGRVVVDNCVFRTVSALIGKRYVKFGVSNSVISNCVMVGSCPVGVEITGNMNRIQFDKGECVKGFVDSGVGNSVLVDGIEKSEKLTGDAVENIGGDVRVTVQGDVTSTVAGNVVDSSMSKTESVTGKRVIKSGSVEDSTTGDRVVKSQSETKTVDDDSIEVIGGDKNIRAESYHASVNGERSENIRGNKIDSVVGAVTFDYRNNVNITVGGNKVETVKGVWQETAEGNKVDDVNGNYERHIIGTLIDTIDSLHTQVMKNGSIKNVTGSDTETISDDKKINADTIELKPKKPLIYSKPKKTADYDYVDMCDTDGLVYNVVVASETFKKNIKKETFDTFINVSGIEVGDTFETRGFYMPDDGGGNIYLVSATQNIIGVKVGDYYAIPIGDTINIKTLGCKSDNTDDCSNTINNLITYAVNNKKSIYIPSGMYSIESSLNVDCERGLTIYGDGDSSILNYKGVDYCFNVARSGDNHWTYNHHFKNFKITFNKKCEGGFKCININESTFDSITIWGRPITPNYGFNMFSPQITRFNKCVTSWCNVGFYFNGSDDVHVNLSNIYKSQYSIMVEYCVGLFVTNNWIEGFEHGVHVSNNKDCLCRELIVENNSFWQSQEHVNSKGFVVSSVGDKRLDVEAKVLKNLFYNTVKTPYLFDFFPNATGYIKADIVKNTIIGFTGDSPLYVDDFNRCEVYLAENIYKRNLDDVNHGCGDSLESTSNNVVKYFDLKTDKHGDVGTQIRGVDFIPNKVYKTVFSGKCTQEVQFFIDSTYLTKATCTSYYGEIVLRVNKSNTDVIINVVTDRGFVTHKTTINLDYNVGHFIKCVGNIDVETFTVLTY
jgi:hypothetical protein